MNDYVKVSQCCHSPSRQSRFEARVRDIVLVRNGVSYIEATVTKILSSKCIEVSIDVNGTKSGRQISTDDVVALMIGE